jgi:hypothetical protein
MTLGKRLLQAKRLTTQKVKYAFSINKYCNRSWQDSNLQPKGHQVIQLLLNFIIYFSFSLCNKKSLLRRAKV